MCSKYTGAVGWLASDAKHEIRHKIIKHISRYKSQRIRACIVEMYNG